MPLRFLYTEKELLKNQTYFFMKKQTNIGVLRSNLCLHWYKKGYRSMRKKLLIVIGVLAVIGLGIAGFSLASNRPMPIQEEQETETEAESASSEEKEETTLSDTEDFISRYESHNLEKYTSGDQKKTFRFLQLNHDVEIHYVSYQDAIQMLQDGKQFALYYGWTTCAYCRSVLEPLFDLSHP